MADESVQSSSSSSEESSEEIVSPDEDVIDCVKVPLQENIAANIDNRELLRETEPIKCDRNLIEKVINNYIIAKNILSNLSWQEKMLCKQVCPTWNSAVLALRREQLSPADFVVDFKNNTLKKTHSFNTEPLVVFTFANTTGLCQTCNCTDVLPPLHTWIFKSTQFADPVANHVDSLRCSVLCGKKHCCIDLVQHCVTVPKHCMLTVRAGYMSYLPLHKSVTSPYTILRYMFQSPFQFLGGLYIPAIPDVKFQVINIKTNTNMQRDFFDVVKGISEDRIFKGILVFVTENFLLHSVEDFYYLNYFKEVQPDVPYALGGCIVEDTMYGSNDIDNVVESINDGIDFVSDTLISIGMFTVPKNTNLEQTEKQNFDMFSVVLESTDSSKVKIQRAINEFSNNVPRFEHSAVLKLSCIGRDNRHDIEQKCFRDAFPNTRLIGCYGNGELGLNHPERSMEHVPPSKRPRTAATSQLGIIYSYSTIFFYFGWGKITSPKGPVMT